MAKFSKNRNNAKRNSKRRNRSLKVQKGGDRGGMYKGNALPADIAQMMERYDEKNPDGQLSWPIEMLENSVKEKVRMHIKFFRKNIRGEEFGKLWEDGYVNGAVVINEIMGKINGLKALEKYYNDRTGNQDFNLGEHLDNEVGGKFGKEKMMMMLNAATTGLATELEDKNFQHHMKSGQHGIVDPENVLKVRQQFMVNLNELYPENKLSQELKELETQGKITHTKEQFIAQEGVSEENFKGFIPQGGRRNHKRKQRNSRRNRRGGKRTNKNRNNRNNRNKKTRRQRRR